MGTKKISRKKEFLAVVIPHTHWDRAWYLPFSQFRIKLVDITEKLLKIMRTDPDFKFTFDGQTIVLEDILEIHPEWEEEIKKYVSQGRLMVGPWYVQADEFLVNGEALIRNLLIGYRVAQKFGRVMKIGYSPDPFGHIAQLPQLLNGFGIDTFIFMRGMGDEGETLGQEFYWQAPSQSSKVLVHHQLTSYVNAAYLGRVDDNKSVRFDYLGAKEKIREVLKKMKPYLTGSILYFSNGTDHAEPQEEIIDIIRLFNKDKDLEISFVVGTPETFFDLIKESGSKFKFYRGELRSGRFDWHLPGVISTRMYMKQENFQCQNLLERWVEPFSVLAYFAAASDDKYAHVQNAWRIQLKNYPHDDACGCGIDIMHVEAMLRFKQVRQISATLIEESISAIIKSKSGEDKLKQDSVYNFAVFNPLVWVRHDVAEINLPVNLWNKLCVLKDAQGNIVPAQLVSVENDIAKIIVKINDVPSLGYTTLSLDTQVAEFENESTYVRADDWHIENEFLLVHAENNGTFSVTDKITQKIYRGMGALEDIEDAGDEYDYSPLKNSYTAAGGHIYPYIEIIESGPVRATLQMRYYVEIPQGIDWKNRKRSSATVVCPVQIRVSLISGVPRLDFELMFDNKAKDHRVRVRFPSDIKTETVKVEEHFHVIERKIKLPEADNWLQKPSPTNHQESFISIDNGKNGFSVINSGLPEYEARQKQDGTDIYLTLFRAVGHLSRTDLMTRPGGAGPSNIETPDAQCPGINTYRFAFMSHSGNWRDAGIMHFAHEYNIPLASYKIGDMSGSQSFIKLEPHDFFVTAVKKAQDRDSLIIRFYNCSDAFQEGKLSIWAKPKKVYMTNLNEERIQELVPDTNDNMLVSADAWEIVTIEVEI